MICNIYAAGGNEPEQSAMNQKTPRRNNTHAMVSVGMESWTNTNLIDSVTVRWNQHQPRL